MVFGQFNAWRDVYESDGYGVASNFMTFFKVQRNLFGFSLVYCPLLAQQLGFYGLALVLTGITTLNIYLIWLLSRTEGRFRNEFFTISSLHDLTYLCFGDWIIIMQQLISVMGNLTQCTLIAIVFGQELAELLKNKLPHVQHIDKYLGFGLVILSILA